MALERLLKGFADFRLGYYREHLDLFEKLGVDLSNPDQFVLKQGAVFLDERTGDNVDFRFYMDVAQLPRPFQIGTVGQPDWRIAGSRNQRLIAESAP